MISTAILAVPYAVLQPESFDDSGSSDAVSKGPRDGEPIDKAMEPDEAASVLGCLALELLLTTSFFMNSIGGVDVGVGGGLFACVAGEGFLRKRGMIDERTITCKRSLPVLGGSIPLPCGHEI